MMNTFPFWLFIIVVASGMISLIDYTVLSKQRLAVGSFPARKPSRIVRYAREYFPVLLIVFLVRTFIVHPIYVPTGSLLPTIQPGDYVVVNAYSYGLRLPMFGTTLWQTNTPKRGDIVQFHWPINPKRDLIKRIIGLPGDTIDYVNKELHINGKPIEKHYIKSITYTQTQGRPHRVDVYEETLADTKHLIWEDNKIIPLSFTHLTVPKGHYFVMGDNRDYSDDSRYWGFVPESALIGKAEMILLHWQTEHGDLSIARSGEWLHA